MPAKVLGAILLLLGVALAARMLFGLLVVAVSVVLAALLVYHGLRLLRG